MQPQLSNAPSSLTTQGAAQMHLETNCCIDHSGRKRLGFETLWGHRTHVKATHEISIVLKRQHWCITRSGHPQTQRSAQSVNVMNTQVAPAPVLMFLPNDMPPLDRDMQAAAHSNERIAGIQPTNSRGTTGHCWEEHS